MSNRPLVLLVYSSTRPTPASPHSSSLSLPPHARLVHLALRLAPPSAPTSGLSPSSSCPGCAPPECRHDTPLRSSLRPSFAAGPARGSPWPVLDLELRRSTAFPNPTASCWRLCRGCLCSSLSARPLGARASPKDPSHPHPSISRPTSQDPSVPAHEALFAAVESTPWSELYTFRCPSDYAISARRTPRRAIVNQYCF